MIKRQAYADEAARIRKWSRKSSPNISFGVRYADGGTHSLREMANDNIDFDDMLRVLRGCRVTDARLEKGEWRHQAEGRDKDGRSLVFIVMLCEESEEIEIVTAWAVK
jgi:hypothetical protein